MVQRRSRGVSSRSILLSSFALLLLLSALAYISNIPTTEARKQKTHYDVLEIKHDASLKDVKKAYRRLAVLHHPDRNLGNEEEATEKFREINEAYEVLSDEGSRREYDRALRGLYHSDGTNDFKWSYGDAHRQKRRQHRDPFAQFNDVFRNDPFFAEAFKSMDDLFDKHFSNNGGGGAQPNEGRDVDTSKDEGGGGMIWNMVKGMMPNVNIEVKTSSSFNSGRSTTHSSTSRSYGGGNSRSSRQHSTSSYTSRSTRTVIQNGQRVTIQSLEKDGNKIEEKYIGEKLIERKINGMKEDLGRIGGGEEF